MGQSHVCGFGSAAAFIIALIETLGPGTEWDTIPEKMFDFANSGISGWGTICGALTGCFAVMRLVCPSGSVRNELIGWYTTALLPSEHWVDFTMPQTVADSPLCHVSVSTWAKVAGVAINTGDKKQRCSRVTGDTAAKAAELLNEYAANGAIVPQFEIPEEYAHCYDCHNNVLHDQQGKMNCVSCHNASGQYSGVNHYSNK